ncbi:hypothetical protein, partial [Colidextribacter sp. OB.20]|uniref:hypothetical protein n=1 Tax=Colidextribacter sp. OB.20 TaxID=2304568 RepID=UPI00136A8236
SQIYSHPFCTICLYFSSSSTIDSHFTRRKQMKLHDNQLHLLRHLARFNLFDYSGCLKMLDMDGTGNRTKLSYAFRPLTKNKYLSKRKDGSVSILAKGRALFPEIKPLIAVGGGASETRRIIEVSRMAALMEKNGVPAVGSIPASPEPCFIPSACWRNIAPGILSTTRFAGMLVVGEHRLAVYDIGDGTMDWQVRAEGSLFYTRYGSYATKATGMLLICRKEARIKAARNYYPPDYVEPPTASSRKLSGAQQAYTLVPLPHQAESKL